MNTKKYISIAIGLATIATLALTMTASAATPPANGQSRGGMMDSGRMIPAVVGKVSAINGNILTVISDQNHSNGRTDSTSTPTPTTYTVDTAPGGHPAKLLRGNTAITLSSIAVGDNIVIQGTLTGTNVVATVIRDGKVGNGNEGDNNQALLQIQGNGQPVIAGTISAISSSTLTVKNSSVTYTVDAVNAKIVQGKNTISIADVKVGDSVIVQGTVTGTSVAASTIFDSQLKASDNATSPGNNGKSSGFMGGMFGGIGNFFKKLFGF